MDVEKLLNKVIAQNEIIIEQNEKLLRLLGENKGRQGEMETETAERLMKLKNRLRSDS